MNANVFIHEEMNGWMCLFMNDYMDLWLNDVIIHQSQRIINSEWGQLST